MEFEGWVIDQDYFDEGGHTIPTRIGYGKKLSDFEEDTFFPRSIKISTNLESNDVIDPTRFRLLDDDEEVYYEGSITKAWLEEEHLAFSPLDFGEADAGCVIMEYKDDNGAWQCL